MLSQILNRKLKTALVVFYEKNLESNYTGAAENVELNGSGLVYDRIGSMNIDLQKDVTKSTRKNVELPIKLFSNLNLQKTFVFPELGVAERIYALQR